MRKFIVCLVLLTILATPNNLIAETKIWLGIAGMLSSGQNLGFNKDAPGVEAYGFALIRRLAIYGSFEYSSSKKITTGQGFTLSGDIGAMYQIKGKFLLGVGIASRFYDAGQWEKQASLIFVGARYGLPDDLISIGINYYFKEHQTANQGSITSLIFRGRLFRVKNIALQMGNSISIVRFNQGRSRKTGISGDIALGIVFKFL